MEENKLIPFEVSGLPDGPWLVFAPHPDDEVFGMGGSLLLARNHGIEVIIIFVTGGGWTECSDDTQLIDTNLVSTRQKEAEQACQFLGISRYEFWSEEDRKLKAATKLIDRVTTTIEFFKPTIVFTPAPTELHPDHRATCDIVCKAISNSLIQCSLATYDIGVQSPVNFFIDTTSVQNEKQELMGVYASQIEQRRYIELVNCLDFARTFTLPDSVTSAEGFFMLETIQNKPINAFTQMTKLLREYGIRDDE